MAQTKLEAGEAAVAKVVHAPREQGAAVATLRVTNLHQEEGATTVWWEDIALATPLVIQRPMPTDVRRGPPHTFDQETLDALASLPQPPEDDECERRWD